jgi:hypothetical protein
MRSVARLAVGLIAVLACAAITSCTACKPLAGSVEDAVLGLETGTRICVATPGGKTHEEVFVRLSGASLVCESHTFELAEVECVSRLERDAHTTWVMVLGTIGAVLFLVLLSSDPWIQWH